VIKWFCFIKLSFFALSHSRNFCASKYLWIIEYFAGFKFCSWEWVWLKASGPGYPSSTLPSEGFVQKGLNIFLIKVFGGKYYIKSKVCTTSTSKRKLEANFFSHKCAAWTFFAKIPLEITNFWMKMNDFENLRRPSVTLPSQNLKTSTFLRFSFWEGFLKPALPSPSLLCLQKN